MGAIEGLVLLMKLLVFIATSMLSSVCPLVWCKMHVS